MRRRDEEKRTLKRIRKKSEGWSKYMKEEDRL